MTLASQRRVQPLEPGWIRYLNHRLPGETPGVYDDFFTDATPPGTALTVSGTATWTQGQGRLSVNANGQATADAAARLIAATITAPTTIETRIGLQGQSDTQMAGVGFANGTAAGDSVMWGSLFLATGFGSGWRSRFGTLTSLYATTNQTDGVNLSTAHALVPLYMRTIWVSANTFKVGYSYDALSWFYGANITPTLSPTHLAIIASTDGTTRSAFIYFDYLRVTAADLSA